MRKCFQSKASLQDSDKKINPDETDIGFHDKQTGSPPLVVQQATPSSLDPANGN